MGSLFLAHYLIVPRKRTDYNFLKPSQVHVYSGAVCSYMYMCLGKNYSPLSVSSTKYALNPAAFGSLVHCAFLKVVNILGYIVYAWEIG